MLSRVLVLDDNHDLAESVREVLEGQQHLGAVQITIAHDAATGLKLAAQHSFDVAIVDVRLPDASGLDLIAPLRAVLPCCEVVLLTGNATVESAIGALRLGAAGFVLKSFRPEELIATVQQALQKAHLRREREKYENRYHALVNAAEVLIVGLEASGRVAFFNPKLSDLLGVPGPDALAAPFAARWVLPTHVRRFEAALSDALSGDLSRETEVTMLTSDGSERRVRWHLSGVREAGESADHVYGIGVDVTERRALERRAANAEAMNAMAPLAMGLAHEIRNPLNAAVLELHLLSRAIDRIDEEEMRAPMRRRVDVVESEIRRLERLLTEFLELARPRPPRRDAVALDRVVKEVLDLEAETFERRQVKLERRLDREVLVLGDIEKLKQVVLNLVVNALEVMGDGGVLCAQLTVRDQQAVLELTDDGPKVDPRSLAEVFDPFFTTKPAGTGLGLAIVRKVVEQHGGQVSLRAGHDRGVTAQVTLPLAPQNQSGGRSFDQPPEEVAKEGSADES